MPCYYIYIMTNHRNGTLYVGVTNDLERRVHEHKEKRGSGFTAKYNLDKLVYFEEYRSINDAIAREKQIKAGSRQKKISLIEHGNPYWKDAAIA